ncbi:hypothetical protein Poly30_28470 [Planctomycetes bacterium Poly30]|uniref:Outer membrane protein beta-barrel domain-containing protein n=1 Tax=Saltatorellus ferox TaxID=2528018 RepID=A0A518ETA9_9BACT|nr:hypothetical protein Poly30_28470 [Planctomycetes bacterium Poly30]
MPQAPRLSSPCLAPAALLLALALSACASTSEPTGPLQTGVEIQAYPAGIIPALHFRKTVSDRDVITARLGTNITDRRDWGEHDDESGSGFGGGLGWRRSLNHPSPLTESGFHYGARLDLWNLNIDWKDPGRSGSTDILVLQPSAEFGYGWTHPSLGRFETTLGLGVEINVDTDGEDVGEGPILLFGLTWLP